MAGFIPDSKIAEIKNTVDIVGIVSESVSLKRSGRNYLGLCPFHSEKTPSFTVSPEKQIFHCFGCGEGGSVFNFVMKQDGFSFPEAVRFLARRCGIEVSTREMTPEQKQQIDAKEKMLEINRLALRFFMYYLFKKAAGKMGLEYLNKRGFENNLLEQYAIGYAPAGWRTLTDFFQKRRIPLQLAAAAGLIVQKKGANGYYDRFRDRIIFPIFNLSGDVIGFGGRVLDDALPKYLNSPETPLYNKSRSLYGLDKAKGECRKTEKAYIVEGYLDLLALVQHKIENVVATLGTALTADHVRILKGFIGENGQAVLVYDSDAAGIKAAHRSIPIFGKGYVDAKIMVLPQGYDPDSFIFKFGTEAFKKSAAAASGMIPFLIESAIKKHGLSIEGKLRVISALKGPLAALRDPLERSLYVKTLSEKVGVEESALLEKIRHSVRRIDMSAAVENSATTGVLARDGSYALPKTDHGKADHPLEKKMISMMLQFPEIISDIKARRLMDMFEDHTLKSIGEAILMDTDYVPERLSVLMDAMENPDQLRIASELAIQEEPWDHPGCLRFISQFETSKNRRNDTLLREIKEAQQSNDSQRVMELLGKKQAQIVKIKNA